MKATAWLCVVLMGLARGAAAQSPAPPAPPAADLTRVDAALAAATTEARTNCGAAVDLAWQAAEHAWRVKPALSATAFAATGAPIWGVLLRCADAARRAPEAALAADMLRQLVPDAPAVREPMVAALLAKYPPIATADHPTVALTLRNAGEATCWVDGVAIGACPQVVPLSVGPHFIAAVPRAPTKPDAIIAAWGKSDARLVWLKADETLLLAATPTIVVLPPPPAPAPQPEPPGAAFMRSAASPPARPTNKPRTAWWVYAAIGTAVAGAATAVVLYETRGRSQTLEITSAPLSGALHQW